MNKLNFIKKSDKFKGKVFGSIKWDTNDADYVTKLFIFDEDKFFSDDNLLRVLTFVTTPYDYLGAKWNDDAFGHHINVDNKDGYYWDEGFQDRYGKILDLLEDHNMIVSDDYGIAHSVESVELYYMNNDGEFYEVDLSSLRDGWKSMTYDEIVESIVK